MAVKAKMYLSNKTANEAQSSTTLSFGAVCRGAANREWASATPAGSLTMTVRNEAAVAQFEVGQEYYLTFEPAEPKPVRHDGHQAKPGPLPYPGIACEICGLGGSWADGQYTWDEAAQQRHDEAYAR